MFLRKKKENDCWVKKRQEKGENDSTQNRHIRHSVKKSKCGYSLLSTGTMNVYVSFWGNLLFSLLFILLQTHQFSSVLLSYQIHSCLSTFELAVPVLKQYSLNYQHGCSFIFFRSLFLFHLPRDAFSVHHVPLPSLPYLSPFILDVIYYLLLHIHLLYICILS